MAQPNLRGDRSAVQRTMEAILADARSRGRAQTAAAPQNVKASDSSTLPERVAELVYDMPARRRLDDLVLPQGVRDQIDEFLHEYVNAGLLREHSLEPRHTILLVGAPGNGKTSLAESIATELSLPLLAVRYDAVVDSFLGETSNRLRKLIDYAALSPCILFFDEFDAVGKERGDSQETGEIKRVVSSLLTQLDRLPSHSIVVCATNHPELLDRAVWRRFEVKLELPLPGPIELGKWFKKFEQSLGTSAGISAKDFVACMTGESMSEVEAFTLDIRRKLVLSKGALTPAKAVREVLSRWQSRLTRQTSDSNGTELPARTSAARASTKKSNSRKAEVRPGPDLLSGAE
ncbi:ATP-binding protein [Burkholderia oklahomensis]|uniref:AAA family ATPase n=1 Tax=Burkholderia TaxID=32008 RepID=UPI001E43E8BE|nr:MULTISPECIES: ATP-binding protein [Burkholderia]MDN7675448.1 ATP-binding protein [Burkholderia oklahomensis]